MLKIRSHVVKRTIEIHAGIDAEIHGLRASWMLQQGKTLSYNALINTLVALGMNVINHPERLTEEQRAKIITLIINKELSSNHDITRNWLESSVLGKVRNK